MTTYVLFSFSLKFMWCKNFITFYNILYTNAILFFQCQTHNKTFDLQSTSTPSISTPTTSTPILFDIIDSSTIIGINDIENEDQLLLETGNKNKEVLNEKENSALNICEPSPKKIKFEKEKFNLKDILSRTAYGQTLLQISQHEHNFTTRCQSILCNIIVTHFLNLNIR